MDLTLGTGLVTPALWAGAVVVLLILLRASNIFRYISNNQVGIVEKLWTTKGSISEGFIALNGEAGYEPDVHLFSPGGQFAVFGAYTLILLAVGAALFRTRDAWSPDARSPGAGWCSGHRGFLVRGGIQVPWAGVMQRNQDWQLGHQ